MRTLLAGAGDSIQAPLISEAGGRRRRGLGLLGGLFVHASSPSRSLIPSSSLRIAVLLRLGYVETCPYSLREVLGSPDPPVVEEHDPGLLAGHVLMNRDDVDTGPTQFLEN